MTYDSFSEHSAFDAQVKAFSDKTCTPREYLETCLEAIDRSEGTVNAFAYYDIDHARVQADASTERYRNNAALSPIDGMPIGVKDIISTIDMPTQMNSPLYEGYRPKVDAASVRAAREGGAIIIGKTVTTEFAIGRSGLTTNPHDATRTPGGSSSGSAAGVAAGMITAGFGTQTNGSIIRPAGFCGVVGYKPSIGMLSTEGIHALSRTNDHLGVIARSVGNTWLLARWVSERAPQKGLFGLSGPISGSIPANQPKRVGVLRTTGFEELDETSMKAFEKTLDRLRQAGTEVLEPSEHSGLASFVNKLQEVPDKSLAIVAYEMYWPYAQYLENSPDKLGPRFHQLIAQTKAMTRNNYRDLLLFREDLRRQAASLSDEFDAFLLPSSSGPAPKGLEHTGSRTLLTYASFLGLPTFSLPVMKAETLPLGLQMVGFYGNDFRLARHCQWVHAHFQLDNGV